MDASEFLTAGQMAGLLGCSEQVVDNMVDMGRLMPSMASPLLFSRNEALRVKKDFDRRQQALAEIIRLGEGLE